jgi:hypothetical protein
LNTRAIIPEHFSQGLYKSDVCASHAHGTLSFVRDSLRGEVPMKPLWSKTLVWLAAVIAAILLALANPDGLGFSSGDEIRPQGGSVPR